MAHRINLIVVREVRSPIRRRYTIRVHGRKVTCLRKGEHAGALIVRNTYFRNGAGFNSVPLVTWFRGKVYVHRVPSSR
jgi:hypothetical protein